MTLLYLISCTYSDTFPLQVSTVFAADAVARMSGTVGVAAVTAGPGLTNTVTAVKNAQMAESPVLLIGKILLMHYLELRFYITLSVLLFFHVRENVD